MDALQGLKVQNAVSSLAIANMRFYVESWKDDGTKPFIELINRIRDQGGSWESLLEQVKALQLNGVAHSAVESALHQGMGWDIPKASLAPTCG